MTVFSINPTFRRLSRLASLANVSKRIRLGVKSILIIATFRDIDWFVQHPMYDICRNYVGIVIV